MDLRKTIWERMSSDFKPELLEANINKEVSLEELPASLSSILKGEARGRTIVRL
jgi:NADPH-dependent curcumin reductase CurA